MKKKTLLLLLCLAGWSAAVEAQSDGIVIYRPQFDGVVIVAGAQPLQAPPIVYNQPVEYNAPVMYNAPVLFNAPVMYNAPAVYNAPVIDNSPPCYAPVACQAAYCAGAADSTVQVIHFGRGQAAGQGYYFNAPR
jgi:hypothetical protein